MEKQKALSLIRDFTDAATRAERVTNGGARGSLAVAARKEFLAAKKLLQAMTNEPMTNEEIEKAIGW